MHAQRLLFGGFVLDPAHGTLLRDGAPVAIGHRAMALLAALAKADGRVLTKAELIDAAWPGAVVAHYALAITSVFASAFEQAVRAAQRAIELAPGFALGHLVLGMARLYSGDAAGAIAPLAHGLQLNRFDPQNFVWYNTLAYAHLFTGDPASALAASRKAQEIRPDWAPAVESALCAFRAQGDELAAGRCENQLMALPPGGGKLLAPLRRSNPYWDAALSSWLAPRAQIN